MPLKFPPRGLGRNPGVLSKCFLCDVVPGINRTAIYAPVRFAVTRLVALLDEAIERAWLGQAGSS